MAEEAIRVLFGRRWACPESARDDYARVISDRKWP